MRMAQIAQHVDDLDRAIDFYTVLLDGAPESDDDEVAFVLDGGIRLVLDAAAPSALLWLQVDNLHEALERLRGLVDVITEPTLVAVRDDRGFGIGQFEVWETRFRDTEGNTVGLIAHQRH